MRCPDHVGAVEVLGRELLWLEQVDKWGGDCHPHPVICHLTALTLLFATSSGFSFVRT